MNKAIIRQYELLAVIMLFIFMSSSQANASYSGGTGSQTMPFQISKAADWQFLMISLNHWSKYFVLTADINLTGINITPSAIRVINLKVSLTATVMSSAMSQLICRIITMSDCSDIWKMQKLQIWVLKMSM